MRKDGFRQSTKKKVATHVGIFHNIHKNISAKTKGAFTLGEVLITLAIIGVIAAVTLPMLVKNYQKKVTETKLRQTYVLLSNAINMAKVENGDVENWGINYKAACTYSPGSSTCSSAEQYGRYYKDYAIEYSNYIIKHLKFDKLYYKTNTLIYSNLGYQSNCAISYKSGACYKSKNSTILGQAVRLQNGVIIIFTLANAVTLKFITIDINGVNKPNITGRDLFYFYLDNNGQIKPYLGDSKTPISNKDCTLRCAVLIMQNDWKINYDW